ncbi:MAG TPA: aldehyde-activating protein [Alphaproteobacteria bacterium]|nr:aldehyde-activating protein [Alphaproteobacteria bacterium]HAJ47094.1 aldehyde-activating protein [Alphaproteobacteria bacterium]
MIEAVCDCGAVRLEIETAPTEINDCQCTWCQRLGALWSYFQKDQVKIISTLGATETYLRGPKRIEFHRCRTCGLTSHWLPSDASLTRMGVNTRLMPREVRARASVFQGM